MCGRGLNLWVYIYTLKLHVTDYAVAFLATWSCELDFQLALALILCVYPQTVIPGVCRDFWTGCRGADTVGSG